ncbi:hypothetical protein [Polaromonas sp.]|uniref:hypothetical protein n=1 Tax=Polaromonas sp. TaxID=1869339 RepID=UPI00286AC79C|nr:hypothetical protein [Polaromonas sp.]
MEKANNPYNYSPATLRALERFGPDKSSNKSPENRPEPLPPPGTDWELWAHMPKATLTEAVAVSLGIDPSAIKTRSGYAEPGKDFDRRLKLACAYVSHAGPLKSLDALPPMHLMYGPATATVSLPQFAAWALSMGWELPDKFPRLKAAPPQPATAKTAPVVPTKPQARPVVTESAPDGMKPTPKVGPVSEKPWLVIDPSDPKAIQPWYTPARYFARQLVIEDSTLLQKRSVLAGKVSKSLADTGFKKRGGKLALNSETVLKAFSNVFLG